MSVNSGFIILDRDGVINHDSPLYVKSPDEWQPIESSLDAIALLVKNNFKVVVATNQSGLARGYFSEQDLADIHQKMQQLVSARGGHISNVFYCPHGPDDGCDCRKPKPGLLHQIESHYKLALPSTPFVGDSLRDLDAARAAGCQPVLVKTGNGLKTLNEHEATLTDTWIFENLLQFAEHLTNTA